MRIDSPLKLSNEDFVLSEGVFHPASDEYPESMITPELAEHLREKFLRSETRCLFSLIEDDDDDFTANLTASDRASLADLSSPSHYNFLLSLSTKDLNGALDLTEDAGGVSGYLAKSANFVDAIKKDRLLADLASDRTASFPNVTHFAADVSEIVLPRASYDLIVIGQLEALGLDLDALDKLIQRLNEACLLYTSDAADD